MENLPAQIESRELMDPESDLISGGKAADALVKIVRKAGLARKFGGEKEHLFYEAWQSLAKFYGCTVRTHDAEAVEIDGIKGAKAKADIVDDATGLTVGGADAYCMRDEPNWAKKPLFQLMSMAQTRAGSKACRNKWAFVPALAGFATTPAEEMDGINGHEEKPPQQSQPTQPDQGKPEPTWRKDPITSGQKGKINAGLSELGYKTQEDKHKYASQILQVDVKSFNDLTKGDAHDLIEAMENELKRE